MKRKRRDTDKTLPDISVVEVRTQIINLNKWESLKEFKDLLSNLME